MNAIARFPFVILCALASGTQPSLSASAASPPKIAFASKHDGNWNIYSMEGDGRLQTRLTGTHLLFCDSPDAKDGRPHRAHGMWQVVKIE